MSAKSENTIKLFQNKQLKVMKTISCELKLFNRFKHNHWCTDCHYPECHTTAKNTITGIFLQGNGIEAYNIKIYSLKIQEIQFYNKCYNNIQ